MNRAWENSDSVRIFMDMPVEIITSNPKVRENAGKVCIMRGPLVYCIEEADNGPNLSDVALCPDSEIKTEKSADLPEGTVVITVKGIRTVDDEWDNDLYRPYRKRSGLLK